MKITQNLRMQNKIKWKNYFKIQTSSFSVKHLQTRNIAIRFLPPRDGEDETDLYAQRISRRIVCKRKKKKKRKISSERRNTILLQNLPTTDIFISAEEAARAVQFPRFLKRIFKVSSSPVDACLGNRLHRPRVTFETVETRNAINHLLPGRVRPTFAAKNLRQEN